MAQIIAAVHLAAQRGLRGPEVRRLGDRARWYSTARDYVEVNQAAVKAMHRQVGDLGNATAMPGKNSGIQ